VVVEADPFLQAVAQLGAAAERMQVKVMVFDGPPQPFNEDVALASAAAVHADSDCVVFENLGEPVAGKLGALICVEDLRFAVELQSLLGGLIAEIRPGYWERARRGSCGCASP
jgi:hypothetical protein